MSEGVAGAWSTTPQPPFLELRGIRKSFGAVAALRGVSLSCRRGQVHALVGENGAGKSTLIQLSTGVYRPDAGEIIVDGVVRAFRNPHQAEAAGIAAVYQELSLIPDLDVAQNIYLRREPRRLRAFLDEASLYRLCGKLLEELGIRIAPRARVDRLSVAQRQLIEIAKALSRRASLVIMDEPTASLTSVEQEQLFSFIERLRARGAAVLYVSHRLEEIFEVADEVSVLRDGQLVRNLPVNELDKGSLVSMMVGRTLAEDLFPPRADGPTPGAEPVMTVSDLSSRGKLADVALQLFPGEIVGVAGLMGSGRTSLLRALFGVDPDATGDMKTGVLRGVPRSPREAIRAGLAFVTEDRTLEGLAIPLSVLANVTAPNLPGPGVLYQSSAARRQTLAVSDQVHLGRRAVSAPVSSLSGGNQQKVVLAKWLGTAPRVLLCDEPTRGIDVGAKAEIYQLLRQVANAGMAVLFVSSELIEVLGLADRVLVMSEGRLVAEFAAGDATEEAVMRAAAGVQEVA